MIESLPYEAKVWTAKAIAGVIIADDILKKEELKIFKEVIGFLEDPKLVNQIVNQVKKRSLPEPEMLKIDRETAVKIIMTLTHTALVDTELTQQEIDYVLAAGKKIGLSKKYTMRIIDWNQNFVQLSAEREKLIAEGNNSKAYYK